MKEKVIISRAQKNDEADFIKFCTIFQDLNVLFDSSTFKKINSEMELSLLFRKLIIHEKFFLYFVFSDLIPVGYFLLSITNKKADILSRAEKYMFVEQIFLLKEYRNKGIAGKMADEISNISKSLGIKRIESEILYQNKKSLAFAKNLGGTIKSVKFEHLIKGDL